MARPGPARPNRHQLCNLDYDLTLVCNVGFLRVFIHHQPPSPFLRALAAADNALMLVDAAKGLEPQTRKLFEVCRMRGLPIFSFCNKLDRPALAPMEIMDQIEAEFGLETHPVVWPVGDGDRFKGLLDRMKNVVLLYEKSEKRGQMATVTEVDFADKEALREAIGDDELFDKLEEDEEILREILPPLDKARVLAGVQSPLFFGSAIADFGVDKFLDYFVDYGSIPASRMAVIEGEGGDKSAKKVSRGGV